MVEEYQENYITGYVSLYRSFIKWEWFEVPNMVTVFIYCLLKANFKDKSWRGVDVKRGQFITSLETMKNETKLSTQKIRTCLDKLEKTQEINKQSNKQYTLITVCKYDTYQGKQELNNKQLTNEQQTTNKQITTTNNINKDNKSIEDRKTEFKNSLYNFLDKYNKDMLNNFYQYWTEHNEGGKKMRFEYAKNQPFNITRRLATWKLKDSEHKREKLKGAL